MINTKLIKDIRESAKMSIKQLADHTKLSTSYLYQVERGDKEPSLSALNKISKALNTPTSAFLGNHEAVNNFFINRVDPKKNKSTYVHNLEHYHKVFPGAKDLSDIMNRIKSGDEVLPDEIMAIYNKYRLLLHENNPKLIFEELLKSMKYDVNNIDITYLYDKIREQIRLEIKFMEDRNKNAINSTSSNDK